LINSAYGQIGERRSLFLLGHHYHMRDVMITNYSTKAKLDFKEYKKVPLPDSLQKYVKNKIITDSRIEESDKIRQIYLNLL
jgi:tetrahydrodipicolinate N-succinyltransferase